MEAQELILENIKNIFSELKESSKAEKIKSLDLELTYEPKQTKSKSKDLKPLKNILCSHKTPLYDKICYIGIDEDKIEDSSKLIYMKNQILDLKSNKKKKFKKLIKDYPIVSLQSEGAFILKNLGKVMQRFGKAPTLVQSSVSKTQVDSILRKTYYKCSKTKLQCKIGNLTDSSQIIIERVSEILGVLDAQNLCIKKFLLKTTQSKPRTYFIGKTQKPKK